jgi:hypothetical protein
MRTRLLLSIGILLLIIPTVSLARVPQLSLAEALSSLDGDFTVPAGWAGIWTEDVVGYDCDTQEQVYSQSFTDTMCAGDPVYLSGGPVVGFECTGTVSDTEFNVECSWTLDVFEGCTASYAVTIHGTRSGDSYTATSTVTVTYIGVGPCEFLTGSCTREESTGTRIAPPPPACGTPVEIATWGGIKALYR